MTSHRPECRFSSPGIALLALTGLLCAYPLPAASPAGDFRRNDVLSPAIELGSAVLCASVVGTGGMLIGALASNQENWVKWMTIGGTGGIMLGSACGAFGANRVLRRSGSIPGAFVGAAVGTGLATAGGYLLGDKGSWILAAYAGYCLLPPIGAVAGCELFRTRADSITTGNRRLELPVLTVDFAPGSRRAPGAPTCNLQLLRLRI